MPTHQPQEIDLTTVSPARIYDYGLGGTENFEADRVAGEAILAKFPDGRQAPVANREWVRRIIRHAISQGVTQFLDIGSGLPTVDNVHEIAQRHAPDARVAYSDNDPIVLAHGRHLLADKQTRYVEADARDPETILADAAELLDFTKPVAAILAAILHFIPLDDDPAGLVAQYAAALPPGSLLAISHTTSDHTDPELLDLMADTFKGSLMPRSAKAIESFFGDLDLLDPGLVDVQRWRPDGEAEPLVSIRILGGLAKI